MLSIEGEPSQPLLGMLAWTVALGAEGTAREWSGGILDYTSAWSESSGWILVLGIIALNQRLRRVSNQTLNLNQFPARIWPGYVIAIAGVAIATLLRLALGALFGPTESPFLTFYPVAMLAALFGGFGAGVLALTLSALAADYLFIHPVGQFSPNEAGMARLALFVAINLMLTGISSALRNARLRDRAWVREMNQLVDLQDLAPLIVRSLDDRIVRWTAGCQRLFGFTPEQALGKRACDLLKTRFPQPKEEIYATLHEKGHWQGELIQTRADGGEMIVKSEWVLSKDEQGQPRAILEVNSDISPLKDAERQMRVRSAALACAADGILITRRGGEIEWMNSAFTSITGFGPEELGNTPRMSKSGVHDSSLYRDMWNTILSGEVWHGDLVNRRKDGSLYDEEMTITPVRDSQGEITHFVAFKRDITERKKAQEKLRESESTLNAVLDALPLALVICDAAGRLVRMNRATHDLWGTPPDTSSCEEYGAWEGYWPDTGKRIEPEEWALARALRSGQRVMGELIEIVRFGTGERRFTINNACPIRDPAGNIIAAVAAQLDVTDRIRAERALRESERRLRVFFESELVAILYWTADGRILDCNDKFLSMLGYTRAELLESGLRWDHLTPPEYWEQDKRAVEQLKNTGFDTPYEKEYLRKDGGRIWVLIGAATVNEARNEGVAFVLDISERKRMETKLKAARRSAERAKAAAEAGSRAKDHFMAVLSHELRTPLTPVMTALSMVLSREDIEDGLRDTLEIVRRNVEMEARLIDDLLDVTRIARGKVELDRRAVVLADVLRRSIEVIEPELEARRIHFGVDQNICEVVVFADPTRLQQVFWNLLRNAIKFTPRDGCVGLCCRTEDGSVIAEVRDSGEGIEPAALDRIFNAFEQANRSVTRQFGGLGLGLAISKALVEMHGGQIQAFSEGKGKGATFRVRLPIAKSDAPLSRPKSGTGPARSRRASPRALRILLVEDHGDTAIMMRRLLSSRGHEVAVAPDIHTALRHANSATFDLLLSDIGLPDGDGMQLLAQLRQQGHRMPAIALSGYGQDEDIRRTVEAGFSTHLTKPASPERLFEAMAKLFS